MNCEKPQRAYISYMKASCGEYAKFIAWRLFEYGYGVFYDRKSPRSGQFNPNLRLAINNSEWFIIFLDKHIFEDWKDGKNWVHNEVAHAIEQKKKFIVIKTPGLDVDKEIPEALKGKLFQDESVILEFDTKKPEKTVLAIRKRFEENDGVGKFEKTVNRIFSGIYLWRIVLFVLLGFLFMSDKINACYSIFLAKSQVEIAYVFNHFGVKTTFAFNYFYIVLGTLLCGIFMYITRKKLKLDIIPLFLADVAGIIGLSMFARKITDTIFELSTESGYGYWSGDMGQAVWSVSEQVAVYMVFITVAIQMFLYLFKRSVNFV